MAKGNLFLGTAANKLGDVVMYRRNGEQLSRVRVRSISNPKSTGQSLQRNYLAPVSKFYAPLAGVLERSWEGLNRSESHNAFNRANINLARSQGYYVPKGSGFVPLPYQLSQGILPPMVYTMGDDYTFDMRISGTSTITSVADLTTRMLPLGYQEGDQVTVLLIVTVQGGDNLYRPIWSRFLLSLSDTSTVQSHLPESVEFASGSGSITITGTTSYNIVAGAVIMSRYNSSRATWQRSTQFLAVDADLLAQYQGDAAYDAAVDSYGNGSQVIQSAVYLNGSPATDAGAASLAGPTVIASVSDSLVDVVLGAARTVTIPSGFGTGTTVTAIRGTRLSDGQGLVLGLVNADGQVYDVDAAEFVTRPSGLVAYYTVNTEDAATVAWLRRQGIPEGFFA